MCWTDSAIAYRAEKRPDVVFVVGLSVDRPAVAELYRLVDPPRVHRLTLEVLGYKFVDSPLVRALNAKH